MYGTPKTPKKGSLLGIIKAPAPAARLIAPGSSTSVKPAPKHRSVRPRVSFSQDSNQSIIPLNETTVLVADRSVMNCSSTTGGSPPEKRGDGEQVEGYSLRKHRAPASSYFVPDETLMDTDASVILSQPIPPTPVQPAPAPPIPEQPASTRIQAERSFTSGQFEPTMYVPTRKISFDNLGGYEAVKKLLRRDVITPFCRHVNGKGTPKESLLPNGAMFWGPPGTGKTILAKALAYEVMVFLACVEPLPVFCISGAELLTKWVGESEATLREIFHMAKASSPSMVIIDELDGCLRNRAMSDHDTVNYNMLSTMLTIMDGVNDRGPVLVVGTTNLRQSLDDALLRPGRFGTHIHLAPPDRDNRFLIIQSITDGWPVPVNNHNVSTLADQSDNCTAAQLAQMLTKAMNHARARTEAGEECEVTTADFLHAWNNTGTGQEGCDVELPKVKEPMGTLVTLQLDQVRDYIAKTFTVKMPSGFLPENSAVELLFSNPALDFMFDPVIFIWTNKDACLLDIVTRALIQQLAARNAVREVDLSAVAASNSADLLASALKEKAGTVVILSNLTDVCIRENGKLRIAHPFLSVLERRKLIDAPLLIVTSSESFASYPKSQLCKAFGGGMAEFEIEKPKKRQIRKYLEPLFNEQTLGYSAQEIEDIGKELLRKKLRKRLRRISAEFEEPSQKLDALLGLYRNLSRVIHRDQKDKEKTNFFRTVDLVLASKPAKCS